MKFILVRQTHYLGGKEKLKYFFILINTILTKPSKYDESGKTMSSSSKVLF